MGKETPYSPSVQTSLSPQIAATEEGIHLREYLSVAFRYRWLIATVFVAVAAVTTIWTFKLEPLFKATATIRIESEAPKAVSFEDVLGVNADYNTQYRILQSRTVLGPVVDKLDLQNNPEFLPKPPPAYKKLIHDAISWVKSKAGFVQQASRSATEDERRNAVIDRVLARLRIEPVRMSKLVKVHFVAHDRFLAAKMANEIIRQFIKWDLQSRVSTAFQVKEDLQKQLADVRAKLTQAEHRLHAYCDSHKIIDVEDRDAVLQQHLREINSALAKAEAERIEKEAAYLQLENVNPDSLLAVQQNKMIQSLKMRVAEVEGEYEDLLGKYKPEFPDVKSVKARLDDAKAKLREEIERVVAGIRSQYLEAVEREQALREALQRAKQDSLDLQAVMIEYTVLKRDVKTYQTLYEGLLEQMKKTSVAGDVRTSSVTVVDEAIPPLRRWRPRRSLNIALGCILGLALGVGLAFFCDYMDNAIRSPDELKSKLGLTELGIIPYYAGKGRGAEQADMIAHTDRKSPVSEAYRSLRTAIMFSSADRPPRSMVCTSAVPAEGKTRTCINLAVTFAQADNRVVLVDADLRKPRIHKAFGVDNSAGLSNILVGRASMEDVLISTDVENLSLLPSGPIAPGPSELLQSQRMRNLLARLTGEFDVVVVDSPPLLLVADAQILGTMVDGVVMVVQANQSNYRACLRAVELLKELQCRVLGGVLNKFRVDKSGKYYGGGYYSYGKYGKAYAYAEEEEA